ncbi:MAG: hypothetical protein ACREQY_17440 [Candidatus Binatia bacterium]
MTSNALAGKRCRVNRFLESVSGRIERSAEGRIRYVTENLGRLLVLVEWDRGGSTMLFPDELEILEEPA